jgi:hypothetical protein
MNLNSVINKEDDPCRTEGCLFAAVVVTLAGFGTMFLVVWGITALAMAIISLFS